ncbi:hypothetical protein BDV38DRAFT_284376 [Aspergillus pseudotamarii]|uniref:Uncharacterized protein n=1 Tax=Aspergillus pseudotamarii TaxID=132259 RepID=A0A5N6SPR6_ASPPS|nr:uncharacterized protein BDV38DRAFT_284376 [Aspergillus pseudotamarii]KAE8135897.1 hypothetical protein BDV38DRAFT_284376 [Aspergillus pseudotamarii]
MHWTLGTWLWISHKSKTVARTSARYQQDTGQMSDKQYHVPEQPKPRPGMYVRSIQSSGSETQSSIKATREGYKLNELRCQRCNGRRSLAYHRKNRTDPVIYPPVGICSREWTGCATAKQSGGLDHWAHPIYELPGS